MTAGSSVPIPRVFLDANVFVKGIVSEWGAAKAVLILGTLRLLRIETSAVVQREVAGALAELGIATGPGSEYERLVRLIRLVVHPLPDPIEVERSVPVLLPLARHRADLAVIVAGVAASPDWMVSENKRHFNPAVAQATGLRIASLQDLLAAIVRTATPLLSES
jgi:hypothetical protein